MAEALATWSTPECPFTIEYSPRVLDDIRLAVVDAFFSLPRGGAEIGGILLGKHEGERLIISDYAALDCEHAFGPSFTLSPRDLTNLEALLAAARANAGSPEPVGWYHSHTRSEIFLSDIDQDIHKRFFPEPWQAALVLKPHTFHPARAGFFFREADGSIHASASYREFVLDPLPLLAVAKGGAAFPVPTEPEPEPVPIPKPEPPPPPATPPVVKDLAPAVEDAPPEAAEEMLFQKFSGRQRPKSRWSKIALLLASGLAVAAVVWGLRAHPEWVPRALAAIRSAPPVASAPAAGPAPASARAPAIVPAAPALAKPVSIGLNTVDSDGQLQIRWDQNAPAVLNATGAVLHIDDGGLIPRDVKLDPAHLQSGVYTLQRDTEKIDVALTVEQSAGPAVRQATTFSGKLPEKTPVEPVQDRAIVRQRDDLAVQVTRLKAELKAATDRNLKLLRSLDDLTTRLKEEQRSRLLNQNPDTKK